MREKIIKQRANNGKQNNQKKKAAEPSGTVAFDSIFDEFAIRKYKSSLIGATGGFGDFL